MNSDALRRFEPFLATPELPSLGPQSRPGSTPLSELNNALQTAFRQSQLDPAREPLVRSLVLLWHDHLDESHSLSQDIHNADGSFLHGIMHRREPDYWNSKYWFNRVGEHPAYGEIARQAAVLLKEHPHLPQELVRNGQWNPNGFVDACERSVTENRDLVTSLQRIQEIEFRVLLKHFCRGTQ